MSIITIEILKKNISFYDTLINIEQKYNAKIYIVGGCVRDILLNIPISDIDIVAENIDYIKLAKNLGKYLKAYTVPFKDNMRITKKNIIIDVSKIRGKNIFDDILHRDFTINNLACDLSGNLIGDITDINNKIIKVVHKNTFDDDPLRIIRAFRFMATFNFNIEDSTLKLAILKSNLLKSVAKERVLEEFRKMFKEKYIEKALNIITSNNILSSLVNSCDLDNEKLFHALKYSCDFALLLCLWCKDMSFIKYLGITSNEQKNIATYINIDYDDLKISDDKALKYFIFQNYKLFNNIAIYIKIKYDDNVLYDNLLLLYNKIDISKSKHINGELLLSLGFKPSPIFSEIINQVSFLLAIEELNKNNMIDYIKNKWS